MIWPSTRMSLILLVQGLVLAAGCLVCQCAAVGDDAVRPERQRAAPTEFRRVFVPADSPEEWPVGVQRFLPLAKVEFSKLIALEQGQVGDDREPAGVRVKSARYFADLRLTDQMQISAELDVELLDQQPRLLPISEFNFSILTAAWGESNAEQPTLGLWQAGSSSIPAVFVERSGKLKIEGLLAAASKSNARKEFRFATPAIVPQVLILQCRANQAAEVTNAELLSKELGSLGESRWSFQLSPLGQHRIRVIQQTPGRTSQELPFVSQSNSYRIEETGLELLTEFRLDASNSTATTMEATVPVGTRVVDVSLDQQKADWKVSYKQGRQVLNVDRPRSDNPQTISIQSLSNVRVGADWELPKIRLQNSKWTEGTVRLFVSSDLQLQSLVPNQCSIQHVLGIDDAASDGEAYRFQEWSNNASLALRLARPKPRLRLQTLTEIELTSNDAKAKLYANFNNAEGNVYQVRAVIAPEWEVESVDSVRGSAIREWHVDRTESSSSLYCQLSDSISAGKPLWLEIEARNGSEPIALPTAVGRLKVIRFLNAERDLEMLSLRSNKPQMLAPAINSTSSSSASDFPRELPENFSEAINSLSAGSSLDVSSINDATVIVLGQQATQYNARILVEAEARNDSLVHKFQLDVSVEAGDISEIRVDTSLPLPESTGWEVAGRRVEVTSKLLSDTKSSEPIPKGRSRYLLRFSTPMSTDFQLRTEYSLPASGKSDVNLLLLPDTLRWEGRIVVRGPLEGLAIDDQGFVPSLPVDFGDDSSLLPILGAYGFGPQDFRRDSGRLLLRLERQPDGKDFPELVAWSGEYQTVQSADGTALHAASFLLESSGSRAATLKLPEAAKLLEVWHNDRQVDLSTVYNAQDEITIGLGNGKSWHQLGLRYETKGIALGGSAKIQPSLPTCSFPVHQSRWTLWAPTQYEIDRSQLSYSSQDYHWWKRIFGPLARSRHEGVFNPVSRTKWSELWNAPLVIQESKQVAGSFATNLTDRIQREPERTIGDVLSEVVEIDGLGKRVLVDRAAMVANGLRPGVLCKRVAGTETDARDLALSRPLASYDLALLVSPNRLVLTTTGRVAHWSDRLRPTRVPGIYLSTSDSLSDSFSKLKPAETPDFVPVASWLRLAAEGGYDWNGSPSSALDDVGRQAQTVRFSHELPTLVVRQAYVQRSLWYAVLLLTLVIGVWQLAHFPNAMILTGAIAGSACLIAPLSWLTIPQAVFLGLSAAALIRVVLKSGEVRDLGRTAARPVGFSILIAIFVTGSPPEALFAEEVPAFLGEPRDLPKVLIPIDSQGNEQGEDVYLSEDFLDSLRRDLNNRPKRLADALVLAAQYDAAIPKRRITNELDNKPSKSDLWTIRLKLETYGAHQEVTLPFRQDEATWDEGKHRLDGLPIKLTWRQSGGCSLVVPQSGTHWLHLVCQPRYTMTEGVGVLRLRTPVVPGAKLNVLGVTAPRQLKVNGVEIPAPSSSEAVPSFLLGSTDMIEISWQSVSSASEKTLWERIEKSCWLSVSPASAVLDVQFRVIGSRGGLPSLSLDVPSQLQLLAPDEDSVVSKVVASETSRPGRVQLDLKPNLPEDFVIPLKFEFKRRIGIGQIYFPRIRLAKTTPDLHRFAVSVAPGLSYDERGSRGLRTLETTEFLEAWDGPAAAPLFAYAIDRQLPNWSLRVWPDPKSLRTQQAMRLACGVDRVAVETLFNVDEIAGAWHVHRLRLPKSLEIEEISVRESSNDKIVASRWSRASSSEVSIFLSRPLSDAHAISVRGVLRNAPGESLEVPQIELVGGGRAPIFMDLYRDESVQFQWIDPNSAPPQSDLETRPISNDAVYVGSFAWRPSANNEFSNFTVTDNDVAYAALSATSLERSSAGWAVRLSSRIQVQRGVLSRLKIEVPENVRPPYKLQSKRSAVIQETADTADGKQLTVLLAKPVNEAEKFDIQLSGTLNLPVDRRLVLPSLQWSGATRSDRYVLLPTRVAGEAITWQRTGLRRQALPLPLVEVAMPGEHAQCFRIEQEEFAAEQRDSQRTMRNARVRHAKVSGFFDANGEFVADAEFFIQLGRATSCAIQLPKQAEVFQLVVGDRPARRERRADGTWKLPVGPPFLPQRILVSYRCPTNNSGDQVRIDPPRVLLGDQVLPLPKVNWLIRAPLNVMLAASETSPSIPGFKIATSDYQVSLQIVDEAFSQVLQMPRDEGRAWAATWRNIIRKARQDWREYQAGVQENSELAAAAETLLAIEDAFADEKTLDQTGLQKLRYPVARRRALDVVAKRNEYGFVSEAGGPLVVTRFFGSQQSPWQWLAAIAMLGGVFAAVMRLRRHPECYHDLCHWPHALAIVLGFAWWLLLSPSVFGLVVISLALISLALRAWRSSRSDQSVSFETRVLPTAS